MKKIKVIAAIILVVMVVVLFTGCGASYARLQKDLDSELGNGLPREIVVYSATGTEIWRFSGKFEIDYTDGRILFDDENNKRHTIYFQNGTVIVNEI